MPDGEGDEVDAKSDRGRRICIVAGLDVGKISVSAARGSRQYLKDQEGPGGSYEGDGQYGRGERR
jgi:hypothetical protein